MPRSSKIVAPLVIAASVAAGLTLTGLISPARAAQRRASDHTIAVCATPRILNDLIESDRFKPDLERLANEKRAELEPMAKQLQEMQSHLQEIGQEDPGFGPLYQQFQQLVGQFQSKQAEMGKQLDEFRAKQVVEAYKLVRSSAQAVADDLGYDYVISSSQEDEEFTTVSVDATLRQIIARPVILYPEGTDITDDVREDLNLE